MKTILSIIALSLVSLTACDNQSQSSKEHHKHDANSEYVKGDVESTSSNEVSLTDILNAYLQLKNALVNDNQKETVSGGNTMLAAFSSFDMSQLNDARHKEYMEIFENSKEELEHIVKSPIDHQREHFEVLSTDLKDLISLLGTDMTLYESFCPMANNGNGAMWLSETEEIKNPYFGSSMLNCGEVQRKIN